MIETYAYARAGLLGNPSDGYYGKTIAFVLKNFRARVLLYPSARLAISASKADIPEWESLDEMRQSTRWRGYYGGIRIIQALLLRFTDYCNEQGIELPNRNFTIEYESTIPLRLGMGGSSAIIIATLRALKQYFEVEIQPQIEANPRWALIWGEMRIKVTNQTDGNGVVHLSAPADRFTADEWHQRSQALFRTIHEMLGG